MILIVASSATGAVHIITKQHKLYLLNNYYVIVDGSGLQKKRQRTGTKEFNILYYLLLLILKVLVKCLFR